MSMFFLTCKKLAESSIERFNIHKILNSCKDVTVRDLSDELKIWTDDELHGEMCRLLNLGRVYALPEVPLHRMENHDYFDKIEHITSKNIPGNLSVLAQVIAVTGYQPSRYDNLISAYAVGHVKALKELGATTEEIKEITLRDRLLRNGGVFKHEVTARHMVDNHQSVFNTHVYGGEIAPQVRDSILDYHLIADDCDLALIFIKSADEDGITVATIYFTDTGIIKNVREAIEEEAYDFMEEPSDSHTGLKPVTISALKGRFTSGELANTIAMPFLH